MSIPPLEESSKQYRFRGFREPRYTQIPDEFFDEGEGQRVLPPVVHPPLAVTGVLAEAHGG